MNPDLSNLYGDNPVANANDPGTNAQDNTALMFTPIELEDVKPGMTLRFYGDNEIIVSTVRIEHFSPVEEAIVVDAIYYNARLDAVFRDYKVTALVPALV